ncbi:LysE family translocator [Vibrio sp. 99-8-1]|uniref:LysE family translocator n=1 Tax=Vibrio sp. 99-8-1 TaxID=2607602 RepID=UPI0014933D97|nr:LysE family translocator [Vibrio sp. 99-8-1]NOI68601.1 LysE family translocator [Vibrio sp. 99-8-1]
MSAQLMTALVLFAISISITPGAGNIALLGISSRYGFAAAMPFVLGNAVGIIIVLAGSSVGLVGLFTVYPSLHAILKFVGAAYLLYLAWSISKQKIDTSISSHPSGFLSGVFIQVVNPKGWVAALTVFSQFISSTDNYLLQVLIIITTMMMCGLISMVLWAYFGSMIKGFIQCQKKMVIVNRCLGGTLVLVVLSMLSQPI